MSDNDNVLKIDAKNNAYSPNDLLIKFKIYFWLFLKVLN